MSRESLQELHGLGFGDRRPAHDLAEIVAVHYVSGLDAKGLKVHGSVVQLTMRRGEHSVTMQWPAATFYRAMNDLARVADMPPRPEEAPMFARPHDAAHDEDYI